METPQGADGPDGGQTTRQPSEPGQLITSLLQVLNVTEAAAGMETEQKAQGSDGEQQPNKGHAQSDGDDSRWKMMVPEEDDDVPIWHVSDEDDDGETDIGGMEETESERGEPQQARSDEETHRPESRAALRSPLPNSGLLAMP